jgi:hypothetical protein
MDRVRRHTFALHANLTRFAPAIGLLTLATLITGGAAANALGVQPGTPAAPGDADPTATATTVSVFPTSAVVGQQFRITANVAPTFGMPSGWADFIVDGTPMPACRHVKVAGPTVNCVTALPTAGRHTLSVVFDPDERTGLAGSTGSATISVDRAATLLVVLPATIPVAGKPFTPTVLVVPFAPGSGHPTGAVIVTDLVTGASCSMSPPATVCELPGTTAGIHLLRAHYSGDDNFRGADSPVVHQIVWAGPTSAPPAAAAPITAAPAAPAPVSAAPVSAAPAGTQPAAAPARDLDRSAPANRVTEPQRRAAAPVGVQPRPTPADPAPGAPQAAPADDGWEMCGALTEQPTC